MLQLKRIFSFLLLIVFILSTTGISVYKHYCGNHLAAVSFYHQHNPCAEEDGEESCTSMQEMSCCDDEFQFYQLDVDLQKVSPEKTTFQLQAQSFLIPWKATETIATEEEELFEKPNPPPIYNVPIYLSSQKLIFYG